MPIIRSIYEFSLLKSITDNPEFGFPTELDLLKYHDTHGREWKFIVTKFHIQCEPSEMIAIWQITPICDVSDPAVRYMFKLDEGLTVNVLSQ